MIHPLPPDDILGDTPCVLEAIGITGDNVLVCGPCAVQMVKEGFPVFPFPERQISPDNTIAHKGDVFRFAYLKEPQFNRNLVVQRVEGYRPEDLVFFEDGTHCKQKHICKAERL